MVNFVDHVKCRGNGTAKCGMWRNSQIIETQVCVCIDFICVKSVLRVFDIFFPSRLHWLKLAIGRRRVAFVTLLRWIFVTPTYVIVVARLIVNNVRTKFIFIWTNMWAFFLCVFCLPTASNMCWTYYAQCSVYVLHRWIFRNHENYVIRLSIYRSFQCFFVAPLFSLSFPPIYISFDSEHSTILIVFSNRIPYTLLNANAYTVVFFHIPNKTISNM